MRLRQQYAREYGVYRSAKYRCNTNHWRYGGRGIRFMFTSFEQFMEHIGPRPNAKLSLDRIDNDGHYEPGNVRWATAREQLANRTLGLVRPTVLQRPTPQPRITLADLRKRKEEEFLRTYGHLLGPYPTDYDVSK